MMNYNIYVVDICSERVEHSFVFATLFCKVEISYCFVIKASLSFINQYLFCVEIKLQFGQLTVFNDRPQRQAEVD